MKKGIVAFIILAAVPFFVLGYASPGKPTGFVNDFASVLSPAEKTELETTLSNFKKETGNEISVVTIMSLGDETVETYAVKLFEEWGIGGKERDTGLLLLVAMEERKMRIEVGYGLEGDITDAQASSIIRNILTPAFKQGKYGEGISEAVDVVVKVLGGNAEAVPVDPPRRVDFESFAFWGFLIFIWLASILGRSKSWWLGGVLGAIAGVVIGFIFGFLFAGVISIVVFAVLGLIFDFIVSKAYHSSVTHGTRPPWWIGGGGFGGGRGGGFGGFGGGRSGGGGSSGGW